MKLIILTTIISIPVLKFLSNPWYVGGIIGWLWLVTLAVLIGLLSHHSVERAKVRAVNMALGNDRKQLR